MLARAIHELKILRLSAGLARTRELLKRVLDYLFRFIYLVIYSFIWLFLLFI